MMGTMPPRLARRAFGAWIGLVLIAMLSSSPTVIAPIRAVALLMKMASGGAPPPAPLSAATFSVREEAGELVTPTGTVRSRTYIPEGAPGAPGLVVVHGVHRLGVDEPRLQAFARAIAGAGIVVLTPEAKELADFRIDAASIGTIGAAADRLAERTGRSAVGVMGMSFAGGLSVLAAADPVAGKHVGFVVSVGGHHDLARVLGFFARSEIPAPDGVWKVHAHDYGVLVVAYRFAEDFFPPADVEIAKDTLRTWLWGDKNGAEAKAKLMSPAGLAKMRLFFDQREDVLAPELLAIAERRKEAARPVSPSSVMDRVRVPVFLLHGEQDDVIPSSEARWIAAQLPDDTPRTLLVTPALKHVELVGTPTLQQKVALAWFMSGVLHAALDEPR
jgi:dienelactone hydrolase